MDFIKNFFDTKLTEESYKDFLEGLINRKSVPHKDIYEETRFMMGAIKDYFPVEGHSFHWTRRQDQIDYLKNEMTFERVKLTYERILLSEKRRMAIFRTYPEKYFDLMDP